MHLTPLTPDYISRHHAGEWFGGFRRPNRWEYAARSTPLIVFLVNGLWAFDPLPATLHLDLCTAKEDLWGWYSLPIQLSRN